MTRNAIEVDAVSKHYQLGMTVSSDTLRDAIAGWARRGGRREPTASDEVWSLRDVSFEVGEGQTTGVIGRNGAGKSTLLKVLTRITAPTSGVSRTRGRVASLLEVGTGFHTELTGRENVYLNGAILGMTRRDVAARYDDIVQFAGVERFMDTPVKRFSSGMYLRLAFAVAAHLEPDVLIVDEVLAVGDADFQRRCLGKMSDVGAEGRTVVFVSHDLTAVTRLCPRALWLESGMLKEDGPAASIVGAYLRSSTSQPLLERRAADGPVVALRDVVVRDASGHPTELVHRDQPFSIEVEYVLKEPVREFDLAIYLTNERGVRAIDEALRDVDRPKPTGPGTFVATLQVPPVLNTGTYSVGLWAGAPRRQFFHEDVVASIRLEGSDKDRPDRVVELNLPWDLRQVDPPTA